MKKLKVFIDGQSGTTGLQIYQKLSLHEAVEIIEIDTEKKKNIEEKIRLLKNIDLTFLCLPDLEAKKTAEQIKHLNCKIIDASTIHRCNPNWVYGLPELSENHKNKIKNTKLLANPGCFATGAILLIYPLIEKFEAFKNYEFHINGYSGYSGGGNSMINQYEKNTSSSFSLYGLDLNHKHLPEIINICTLKHQPIFIPSVINIKQGMIILIPINLNETSLNTNKIKETLENKYHNSIFVNVKHQNLTENKFLNIEGLTNTNYCDIYIFDNEIKNQIILIAKFDNLGKGASGAAIQNMNIMFNFPEQMGLT